MHKKILVFISFIFFSATHAQNWIRHTIDNSLSGADGIKIADINNDGLTDITVGWEESGYTKLYIHPGYSKVKGLWSSVIVGKTPAVEDAVFIDVDNNGVPDVVSCAEGFSKKMYVNYAPKNSRDYLDSSQWKTNVFPNTRKKMKWMFAEPCQLDGNFGVDIVAGGKGRKAQIGWLQAPENTEILANWTWYPIKKTKWIMSIIPKDMDGDGDMDILFSDRYGKESGVYWAENQLNTKKQWILHLIGAKNQRVMFIDTVDLNRDGLQDIIAAQYSTGKILYLKRKDNSALLWETNEINTPEYAGRAKAIKAGDLNGDGQLDIVYTTNTLKKKGKTGVIVLYQKAKTQALDWEYVNISHTEGYKFDRIELLDMDGDGDLDILTTEENYGKHSKGLGVIWYENVDKK